MKIYNKILAAVDGSLSSTNAFLQACKIAKHSEAWLTAITTVPIYEDQFDVLSTKEALVKLWTNKAEKILADIKEIADKEKQHIHTIINQGSPSNTIVDIANDENYNLIVMGRYGRSNFDRALMGSVTARVVASCNCDILIVPKNTQVKFGKVLLAVDNSKYSDIAVQKAFSFAQKHNSKLVIISVIDITDEFFVQAPDVVNELIQKAKDHLLNIKEKAEENGIETEILIREGRVHEEIQKEAIKQNADLIFMGSYGRTGLKKFFMGSAVEKVIGSTSIPLFVAKS